MYQQLFAINSEYQTYDFRLRRKYCEFSVCPNRYIDCICNVRNLNKNNKNKIN